MKTRYLIILLFFLLLLPVIIGCSADSKSGGEIVSDILGREVTVPGNIERIVAIGPGALRLCVYSGLVEKVVGVEQFEINEAIGRPYKIAYPALAELPVIGQGGPNNAPDPEKILNVTPDIIFSTYATDSAAADELQSKTGIPVVVISYSELGFGMTDIFGELVQDSLLLIGDVTGQVERAQEVIDFIRQAQQDLDARTKDIPDADKPSVYVGGLGSRGTHGIESTQGQYSLLDAIHAKNVVDETGEEGSVMVDKEVLLEWDPDYIFIDQNGYAAVLEDYNKNPTFYESLSAVKNGNVYSQLPFNYYNTNLGTAIADAYFLGKIVYPDSFADIEPDIKADEIYQALIGLSVYDQMANDFIPFGRLTLGD